MNARIYKYNRRSLRLPHYDYSRAGYYFVTITTQNREHLFGKIVGGEMVLNVAGRMVEKWYKKLEEKFPNVKNHEMVIMPNHIHFIIEIMYSVGANPCVRPFQDPCVRPHNVFVTNQCIYHPKGQTRGSKGQTRRSAPTGNNHVLVGSIVQWFKTMTTNTYIKMVKTGTLPPFNKRIWQRNFYEHIIRDANDYTRIAEYIINNPLSWEDDMFAKNE